VWHLIFNSGASSLRLFGASTLWGICSGLTLPNLGTSELVFDTSTLRKETWVFDALALRGFDTLSLQDFDTSDFGSSVLRHFRASTSYFRTSHFDGFDTLTLSRLRHFNDFDTLALWDFDTFTSALGTSQCLTPTILWSTEFEVRDLPPRVPFKIYDSCSLRALGFSMMLYFVQL
jgi:hypothetical protein